MNTVLFSQKETFEKTKAVRSAGRAVAGLRLLPFLFAFFISLSLYANPGGATVVQGSASFSSSGSQLTIQTSDKTQINWNSFNIGVGETTTFVQPSSSSVVWNRINDPNPSQILGNLNANGYLILQNSSGFYIGGQAAITAHGIVMTTAPTPPPDLSSGGAWEFNSPPPVASVINYGQLRQPDGDKGGSIFVIAADIQNKGTISAPQGNLGLYAGKEVLVSSRPDGRGLSAKVTLPQGSIDNQGQLIADAGTIAMQAQVVNQGGLVQANSIRNLNGVIELVASDTLNLGANSTISAQGDATSANPSQGGFVVLRSDKTFSDTPTSTINVSGTSGGRDGVSEFVGSGLTVSAVQSQIDAQSASSFLGAGGLLLVNPQDITLSLNSSTPSASSPNLNVNDLSSFSKIDLFALGNINVNPKWSIADSQDTLAQLTLTAQNSINFSANSGISAGKNWDLTFSAGPQGLSTRPNAGTDGIYLNGTAFIQAQNGQIDLWAANEILINAVGQVGNNGVRTLAGGSINVTAQYGDVNTGGNSQGFLRFTSLAPFYTVSKNLGGISTVAGGDVTIAAGGNVTSFLPYGTGPTATTDAGTGAFGPEPGNVTITAGGSVFGHFIVANGSGTITAGGDIGGPVSSQNVALSLIKGSWTVNAPDGSIYLQEVRNPNGIFNGVGQPGSAGYHYFDYDPRDSVTLDAAEGVYLTGLNLPRGNDQLPAIYPPTLLISAGSGGLVLQDNVTLFPSPYGELQITTTGGGGFVGNPNNPGLVPIPELLMSDSSQTHWLSSSTFTESDYGAIPIELNNPNPVAINISGSMNNLILAVSKAANITIGGDMVGCSFSGQNLRPTDTTSINVKGQIYNRSPYSFTFLSGPIGALPAQDTGPGGAGNWFSPVSAALNPVAIANLQVPIQFMNNPSSWASFAYSSAPLLAGNPGFVYNPTTRRLGFSGEMPYNVRSALEMPLTVLRYGPDGFPVLDANRHFVTDQITWLPASVIEQLYQASLGAPSPSSPAQLGYRLGGPGFFDVQAGSISLGNSYGILTSGAGDPAGSRFGDLARLSPEGASINVTVAGDLDMITSTIASLGGGNVNVTSTGGSIDLGSQELFSISRSVGLGLYTAARGDVSVTALGNIDVNGSRIAAYDGGNISVTSLQGDVNAGSGGTTFVSIPVFYVDPVTHKSQLYQQLVFGSGIVANTLVKPDAVPGSATQPGNITVQTPEGNILASLGGIVQEALNGNVAAGPTITLIAGTPGGHTGNIDLGESGVIGGTINAQANGNITGLVISRQNSTINAAQSFSGTVLSGGTANLSAGGTISGTIVGIGGVTASGGQGISATLLSQNVSVGGQTQSTLGTSSSATAASQSAAQQANTETQQMASNNDLEDDKKKGQKPPVLVRRVGRVTVILPPG